MTPATEIKRGSGGNRASLIVTIPLAVMVGAAVTYGAMTNEIRTLRGDVIEMKPRLRCVEQATVTLTAQLATISRQLERMENKLDRIEGR